MKIYTGFGDKGRTALFGGQKVDKHHLRVECYGALDELNAWLGKVAAGDIPNDIRRVILTVQNELFVLGSAIATPDAERRATFTDRIDTGHIQALEETIDRLDADLPKLKKFILPGGVPAAADCHVARTVCRRAERRLTELAGREELEPDGLVYLNRLSDLLFVMARYINYKARHDDVPWEGIRRRKD
ncbi:MAG: cob(I)yrinic acid a,c-diamide adenosyltransferase [Calditrichaeota bacterium]|nr:MAG: cob(I)yrinic acid a,c-diamide adenosyltransferase [Calditrichota bacterium]